VKSFTPPGTPGCVSQTSRGRAVSCA
jgi:hypothetical protein